MKILLPNKNDTLAGIAVAAFRWSRRVASNSSVTARMLAQSFVNSDSLAIEPKSNISQIPSEEKSGLLSQVKKKSHETMSPVWAEG